MTDTHAMTAADATGCALDHDTAADTGLLCHAHHKQLRITLLELPAVAAWLAVNIAAGGVALDGERVSGSREDPIPLRVDVLDLIGPDSPRRVRATAVDDQRGADAIRATVAFYTQLVHDESGAPYPPVMVITVDGHPVAEFADRDAAEESLRRVRWDQRRLVDPRRWQMRVAGARDGWPDRAALSQTVGYLAGRLSWIVEQSWVASMVEELRLVVSGAHRLAPWREEILRDDDPCVRCGRRAVVVHVAAGESRCERRAGGCGRSLPLSEFVLNALLPQTRRAG